MNVAQISITIRKEEQIDNQKIYVLKYVLSTEIRCIINAHLLIYL